ncbi:MAG: potassium-transporting ATPase subunit KdpC [Chitinophagaceae bacterium]
MKNYLLPSIRITLVMLVICGGLYFGIVTLVGKLAPGTGKGQTLTSKGRVVGYENIGQSFTEDRYFWGRPSAVNYNAAGSAGSNKGPSNPDYLATVQARIDSFLAHNPDVKKAEIPAELVTASGSGLDPHISPEAAKIQVARVAKARNTDPKKIQELIIVHTSTYLLAPDVVNVLALNISLDNIQ